MKICTKCKTEKPLSDYGKKRDGLNSRCLECERKRGRERVAKMKDLPETKYKAHKTNANKRGIEFNLTFDEWMRIWNDSGKFSERGRGSKKYVMCRIGDCGAYSIDNVFIATGGSNVSDGNIGKKLSKETKAKIGASKIGKPRPDMAGKNSCMHDPEVKEKVAAKIRGGKHYKAKKIHTPDGIFDCQKDAGKYYGITPEGIGVRIRSNNPKYSEFYAIAN